MNQEKLKENIWQIIENYFSSTTNPLSSTQIDSYNMFLQEQIPKTLRQFNPISMYFDNYPGDDLYRFKLEIYMGASSIYNIKDQTKESDSSEISNELEIDTDATDEHIIINDGDGVYFSKPTIPTKIEKTDEEIETDERLLADKSQIPRFKYKEKQLFPNEARLKNITYKTEISCDIFIKITELDNRVDEYKKQPILERKYYKYEKIPLGNIPIMLHSKACVLHNMSKPTLSTMGECIYDQGGYFIIDGKEKVIVAQERQVENKLYIKKYTNPDDNYDLELEIRSVPEAIFQPARITKLVMLNQKYNDNKTIEKYTMKVLIPNIINNDSEKKNEKLEIPLILLFRALGIITDKSILELIAGNSDIKNNYTTKEFFEYLIPSFNESRLINTQMLALNYLKEHVVLKGSNTSLKDDLKITVLLDTLKNHFIPHMGTEFLPKAHYLSYMVREVLLTKIGYKNPTDRDSFINSRVDVSGDLMSNIFRDLYFRIVKQVKESIHTTYYKNKETVSKETNEKTEWSQPDTNTGFARIFNIITSSGNQNSININKLIDKQIMDDGFIYVFKIGWGLKDSSSDSKEGVVQDLNRLNYLGYISHIRRVNKELSASAKIRSPHSLHSSSYGIMCPDETPDGGNIGLKKSIALFAKVTFKINSQPLLKILINNDLIPYYSHKNYDDCSVFLNERIVGYHSNANKLVKKLKLLRRNGLINIYTSIAWYVIDNKIKISTDSGRCCRPLLIVENQEMLLNSVNKKDLLVKISKTKYAWKYLVGGTRLLRTSINDDEKIPYIDYEDKYIENEISSNNKLLEQHCGIIEYIDTEEANTCLIAMNNDEIINNKTTRFTHCEIHPSLMFGVLAINLPLIEKNQHPRNQFATIQSKQAIGIYGTNFMNRMDTKGQILFYPQKPLLQSIFSNYLSTNDLPNGINAIVAILSYSGYNQEDSIIFNEDSVERGLFKTIKFKTFSSQEEILEDETREMIVDPFTYVQAGLTITDFKPTNYNNLDKYTGIVKENVYIDEGDIIIGKLIITNELDSNGNLICKDNSVMIKRNEKGFVDKVYVDINSNDLKYCKIRIRQGKLPEIGDKFCSRYGQKGTIGLLIKSVDLPITKDGIVPDLIINPHAIPSRMTLGQILETVLGKTSSYLNTILQYAPFSHDNLDSLSYILEKLKFDRYGNEILYSGRTGQQLKTNIFIGPTYYQRLTHQVSDKFYSRDEGSKTVLSHQPVGGRAAGGGLRIGEMERDVLLAHGTSSFLKESMMERSDKYRYYISDKSGLISIVNKSKNIYQDFSNDETKINESSDNTTKVSTRISDSNFYAIETPYSFKLLSQELESMSIAPRLITSKSKNKWMENSSNIISPDEIKDRLSTPDVDSLTNVKVKKRVLIKKE